MTTFELLSLILGILAVLGGIVTVWIKTTVAIAKIEVRIVELQHDLDSKEIAILKIERDNKDDFRENREDHKTIMEKIDKMMDKLLE